ncbi:secretion-regulating guanine nucleotide exchange factor isoform X2 [Salvia splendens]|uniref:secretion-regulating guanine nucleotide exchange factor isoform X2 n=1 Tax=Salvia splendens TaxID=180675 RepID=UPI001C257981|nr:secretion-regulating guanine nucleotide exchange factor isoform X2 [Salvia splendens]
MLRFLNKNFITRSGPLIRPSCRWLSVETTVMSFGDDSQGALGLYNSSFGLGSDAYEPTRVLGLPPDICDVAAGHYHSLAVTSKGHVWAWGRNNESQLGRSPLSPRETWSKPQKVEGLDKVMVRSAFASGVVSAAIGDDGALWVWGKSKRGQLGLGKDVTEAVLPARVESLLGHEVVKVSLGWGHVLALTKGGKLFGWGYYADCRLGRIGRSLEASPLDSVSEKVISSSENKSMMIEAAEKLVSEAMEKETDMPIIWEPTLIEEVSDAEVVDIACGLDHSLILCGDGTLLSGGSNVYGQLGHVTGYSGLHSVDLGLRPICVASGLGHSLAICNAEEGPSIVTWGWNQSSQLGRDGPENVPLVVDMLGELPVSVSGGRVHSIAVTEKREVWSWGCGRNGRLGLGSSGDEAEPMLVEYLEGCDVLQAVAGFDHNLVLVRPTYES